MQKADARREFAQSEFSAATISLEVVIVFQDVSNMMLNIKRFLSMDGVLSIGAAQSNKARAPWPRAKTPRCSLTSFGASPGLCGLRRQLHSWTGRCSAPPRSCDHYGAAQLGNHHHCHGRDISVVPVHLRRPVTTAPKQFSFSQRRTSPTVFPTQKLCSGSESVRPTLAALRLSFFQLRSCALAAPNRAPYLQGSSLASWYGSVTAAASQYRWMHGPLSPVARRLSRSQTPRLLVLQCSLGFGGPHLTLHCVSSTGLSAQLAACPHPPRPRRLTSQPTRRSLRTGRLATARHFGAMNRLRLHGTS